MTTSAGIYCLPIELIAKLFAPLDLKLLIRASHVCRSWRLVAFDDPLYWRRIVIYDISPNTLDLAEHRLAAGRGRPGLHFEIDYRLQDRVVETRLLPMLAAAISYARVLAVRLESIYRLQIERILSAPAEHLEVLHLLYDADPRPEIILSLPLSGELFARATGKLREVRLRHIILPQRPIAAFLDVEEVWWLHDMDSHQNEFPCYLFDFFPKMRRFRMSGGEVWFANSPLPKRIVDSFSQLVWVDIEVRESSQSAFFRHLPMDTIGEIVITGAEFDAVYDALEPLRSYFHMAFTNTYPNEFYISVRGQSHIVRHFSEAYKYYEEFVPGSALANCIFEDTKFFAQLGSLQIQTSLWKLLLPWLPALTHLPKLIVEVDDDRPAIAPLPQESLNCPHLTTLVIQAKHDFSWVTVRDVVAFADRLTTERVALQLRRVLIDGQRELLTARFESVHYSLERYLIAQVP